MHQVLVAIELGLVIPRMIAHLVMTLMTDFGTPCSSAHLGMLPGIVLVGVDRWTDRRIRSVTKADHT